MPTEKNVILQNAKLSVRQAFGDKKHTTVAEWLHTLLLDRTFPLKKTNITNYLSEGIHVSVSV